MSEDVNSGIDNWEQKYRSIGQDRHFLTGVTDEQNVYHKSNITTSDCKSFYLDLMKFICKRMSKKISKKQSLLLQIFIFGDMSYKSTSTSTEKTIQNTHKMFNKDVAARMRREVFRDAEIKKFIGENAPFEIRGRMLSWFDKETKDHYLRQCTVCCFKMTSEEKFTKHFTDYEKCETNKSYRRKKSRELHQEYTRKQKKIVRKYFSSCDYTESNLNEFMLFASNLGFTFSKEWIMHYFLGQNIQLLPFTL
jgi:hypothetical protein